MPAFSDLRLLNVFATVYRQRGVSAAARILNISQPAISRSIRKLEDELGAPLFERARTGFVPTDFGSRVYRRALAIIGEVDSIRADAEQIAPRAQKLIMIGVGLGCWISVCDAMVRYQKRSEEVAFNATVGSARRLLSQSEKDGIDVIAANRTILETDQRLHVEPWKRSDVFLMARKGHDVFSRPENQQLNAIHEYPLATHHMIEYAHGSPWNGMAALRASDHLYLLRYASMTDCYLPVNDEMRMYAEHFGLSVVGNEPVDTTEFAVAWRADGASAGVLEFARFLLSSPHSSG